MSGNAGPGARPALMLVADVERARGRDIVALVEQAVAGGADMVQLRARGLPTPELIDLGSRVKRAIGSRALLLVNRDVEAALAIGARGIHFPEAAEHGKPARAGMIVSRAVHSVEAAVAAEALGASLLVAGTVFASASHPGGATLGVDGLRAICGAVRVPVIAIGGVTAANAQEAMRAGANGVAVIGAIFDAADARTAAAALRAAIDGVVTATRA